MNTTNLNKNNQKFSESKIDWNTIQSEMKNKLGNDIYESWLKKIDFVKLLNGEKDKFSSDIEIRILKKVNSFFVMQRTFLHFMVLKIFNNKLISFSESS